MGKRLDFESKKKLVDLEKHLADKLKKAQLDSTRNAGMWQAGGTIVGAAAGGLIGGLPGAAIGAQTGGAAGTAAGGTF